MQPQHSSIPAHQITGVILAGGQARRMNGVDKGLLVLHGKPLITHVIDTIKPQVGCLIINANRNLDHYHAYGYPVVQDTSPDPAGPLSGMASALFVTRTEYALIVPCDSPHLPHDLVTRLATAFMQAHAAIAVAHDGTRMQPVVILLRRELAADMLQSLTRGHNKVERWITSHRFVLADFSDQSQAFKNINTAEDL